MNRSARTRKRDRSPRVECVPNFSEGRDPEVIAEIVQAIEEVPGNEVLDLDTSTGANRTVVTFIGSPESVSEGAFRGIQKAGERIDMRKHHGAHPRMGATDVCPFVPVSEITMADCVAIARSVGERVGRELGIPVFLYGEAAGISGRRDLADIRRGEYEEMPAKMQDPVWRPDFGPREMPPETGCTAIGAREYLIAYNINLDTSETAYATDIALNLREKGRTVRTGNTSPFYYKGEVKYHRQGQYYCGSCEFTASGIDMLAGHTSQEHGYNLYDLLGSHGQDPEDLEGQPVKRPGHLSRVQAMGWYMEDYDCAQISVNLLDYTVTPLHEVFEAAREEASVRGVAVTGGEIVGMVPFQALLESGKYYLGQEVDPAEIPREEILEEAVRALGLRDKTGFDIEQKVLGLQFAWKAD